MQWGIPSILRQLEIWACQVESKNYIKHSENLKRTCQIFYDICDTIEWNEPGKELIFKGQLFDVVSIIKTPRGCLVNCYQDDKEDRVIAYYKEQIKQNKTGDNPYSKVLKKIIDQKFISYDYVIAINPEFTNNKISSIQIAPVGYAYLHLNYPPPEIA